MSDEKPRHGDLSDLADDLPPTKLERSVTATPLGSVEEGDTAGETARPVLGPDGRQLGVPTAVHTSTPGEEQLRALRCKQKPCAACRHGFFPHPNSAEYRAIETMLAQAHGQLGIYQNLGPRAFKWCTEDPDEGPGAKWVGYNCSAWCANVWDALPEYLPAPVRGVVEAMRALSHRLLTDAGALRRMLRVIQGGSPR